MFKFAGNLKSRVLDEFGSEVSAMQPNCFMEITCRGANATLVLVNANEDIIHLNFTRRRVSEMTNTTVFLLSWATLAERFPAGGLIQCDKAEDTYLTDLTKSNNYHLKGKEQERKKRWEKGSTPNFEKGKHQCSNEDWEVCGASTFSGTFSHMQKEEICNDSEENRPDWGPSVSECESLLEQGYTPLEHDMREESGKCTWVAKSFGTHQRTFEKRSSNMSAIYM